MWHDRRVPHPVQLIHATTSSASTEYASAAVVAAGSRLIFLAGACPLNVDGTTAAPGDYAGQAAACLRSMAQALSDTGASIQDVVSTRILVASDERADLSTVWQVVRDAFGDHDVPSTLLGVTVLGYDGQLVEIEAIAALAD